MTTRRWTTIVAYEEAIDPTMFEPIEGIGQWGQTLPDGRVEWRLNADHPWQTLDPVQAQAQHAKEWAVAASHRQGMVRE